MGTSGSCSPAGSRLPPRGSHSPAPLATILAAFGTAGLVCYLQRLQRFLGPFPADFDPFPEWPFRHPAASGVGCFAHSLNARPFGLAFGHGLRPLVQVGNGRLPRPASLPVMAIADPLPVGGRYAPANVCSGSVSPQAQVGGETGRFVSAVAATPRFRIVPLPVPPAGESGEKEKRRVSHVCRTLPLVATGISGIRRPPPALRQGNAAGGSGPHPLSPEKGRMAECRNSSIPEFRGFRCHPGRRRNKARKGKCLNSTIQEFKPYSIPEFLLSSPPLSLTTKRRQCRLISDSTNSERSMPVIAACTVSRCDASTDKWIVDLTFEAAGRTAALAAGRFRALPLTGSFGSAAIPSLRLKAQPQKHRSMQVISAATHTGLTQGNG